ncbi:MAG TPA: PadR family transcriptional regulator [Longilinea sp.]|nr:PadR family transcriptional regulator [Longilinea sp.]
MSPRRQSPLTNEYILLGLLHRQPGYGYDIYKELNGLVGLALVWRVKQSQLYALLDKLEMEGLLESRFEAADPRPTRKMYTLTEDGRQLFKQWVSSPVGHGRDMRQNFLARLYFARQLGDDVTRALVEQQIVVCKGWLEEHRTRLDQLDEDRDYERIVYRYRITNEEAMLAWLQEVRAGLAKPG